jgi:hypothetical protein
LKIGRICFIQRYFNTKDKLKHLNEEM